MQNLRFRFWRCNTVLDAIKGTLEEAGMTMDDLVYVQIFCSDVSHYASFNEV